MLHEQANSVTLTSLSIHVVTDSVSHNSIIIGNPNPSKVGEMDMLMDKQGERKRRHGDHVSHAYAVKVGDRGIPDAGSSRENSNTMSFFNGQETMIILSWNC